MNHIKYYKQLNEAMTNKQLLDELKSGAAWIEPIYVVKNKKWGVEYWKNKEKYQEGSFNTLRDVHKFLEENNIEYKGQEGYKLMKQFRDKEIAKLPFQSYQRYLIDNELNDFDIDY
jgi:hypothetical protein